jgi:hypothetical protein
MVAAGRVVEELEVGTEVPDVDVPEVVVVSELEVEPEPPPPGGVSMVPQAAAPRAMTRMKTASAARTSGGRDIQDLPPFDHGPRTQRAPRSVPASGTTGPHRDRAGGIVPPMIRTIVMALDLVLGAAAVAGGAVAVARGNRVPPGWLHGTPFRSFFWPGLVLLVLVGGSLLAAGGLIISADAHIARLVSVEAGVVLLGFSAVMLSALHYRHWLQVLPLVLGVAVIVLSFGLPVPG